MRFGLEPAKRNAAERRQLRRYAFITLICGLLIMACGIFGGVFTIRGCLGNRTPRIQHQTEAIVLHAAKLPRRSGHQHYWGAKLQYEIGGVTYTGKAEFETPLKEGDTVTVWTYRTSGGEYRIPLSESPARFQRRLILFAAMTGWGVWLGSCGANYALQPKPKKRRKNKGESGK